MYSTSKVKYLLTIILFFLLGSLLTLGALDFFNLIMKDGARAVSAEEKQIYKAYQEKYSRINSLSEYLGDNYYKEIDDEAITLGLLRGLFGSPEDPYTMYYTKDELDDALATTNGEISGIGITLRANEFNEIQIISVVRDSPAEKAGIHANDVIISINNILFTGTEINEAVQESQGDPGTKVEISISRDGQKYDFSIERDNFIAPSVSKKILDDNIGYIGISTFNQSTAEDFELAIKEMESDDLNGVVIDVRNNGGGIVDQAISMLDVMIDESVVVYTEDGKGNREEYNTSAGSTSLPYVVLINKNSASSAEIFALGIKNMNKGKLVGETTFGKGVIQKIMRFDEGDGARITVMQYVAPDGSPVNGVGVKPDIEVAPSEDGSTDPILEKGLELLK